MNKKMIRLTEGDLHSEELYNRAWENLWSQFDKNRKSINWAVYERYKGNPDAIKRWFERWGIDVNEYLNEARNINKKQIVRLTESDLHGIVKESLKRALSETADHNMAVDDKKYFDSDESWKAKKYQDERDKFLTNPNYVGTPSLYDPMNYKEVEDFVDDEEDGTYKRWMDEIGYEGATNNDSIYNIKGDFHKLANKQREHLLNQQTKPWLHNESKNMNKKLVRLTESDIHRIVKESVNKILRNVD